jgi:hypothetical protein
LGSYYNKTFILVWHAIPDLFSFKDKVYEGSTMGEKISTRNMAENKALSRYILDNYYSVQFSFNDMGPIYLFKLRDISLNRPCILVKEDSSVFEKLEVGDILHMKFNPLELSVPDKLLKTKIISKYSHNLFSGHSLVGLSIIEDAN